MYTYGSIASTVSGSESEYQHLMNYRLLRGSIHKSFKSLASGTGKQKFMNVEHKIASDSTLDDMQY